MRKTPHSKLTQSVPDITEESIRDYAYHLYEQSGRIPGHDLDHWLEARACLMANIPTHQSRSRLHHHVNGSGGVKRV